jgi:hypothetical protein
MPPCQKSGIGVHQHTITPRKSATHMKYTVLALAAALVAVGFSSCASKPAPQQPPMVDVGYRSSK